MKVEGEGARGYSAIRTDSMAAVEGNGRLVYADTDTGEVRWKDKTDELRAETFGAHAIRIVSRPRLSRGV